MAMVASLPLLIQMVRGQG